MAIRISGPIRTAIISLSTLSPSRIPASKRPSTISTKPLSTTSSTLISGYSLRNDFNFGQTRLRAACSPADKRILALQSSAAGSAQNVGIQILDSTGEVLVLDGATFSAKTDLIDGTNILPFQARYIALGQSVAGTANADATFKVQYL
ncbi:fimbrial protein [Escherichia coli]